MNRLLLGRMQVNQRTEKIVPDAHKAEATWAASAGFMIGGAILKKMPGKAATVDLRRFDQFRWHRALQILADEKMTTMLPNRPGMMSGAVYPPNPAWRIRCTAVS